MLSVFNKLSDKGRYWSLQVNDIVLISLKLLFETLQFRSALVNIAWFNIVIFTIY